MLLLGAGIRAQQDEEADLSAALRDAGSSPIEFIRALESHLARYPKSERRAEVERAIVKAAEESHDERRIALYGERVLQREPDDLPLLEGVARALVSTSKPDAAGRALGYAKRAQQIIAAMRSQKPPGRLSQGRWNEEVDRGLARVCSLQAQASGVLGRYTEAVALARTSFEAYPNAEAARQAGRWLAAEGKPLEAAGWYATAFTMPDAHATDAARAGDRALMGELYRKAKGDEKGLGDLVLAAYDRTAGLLAERHKRLAAADPNAGATQLMEFTLSGLNGEGIALRTLRGKTIVFDFWATWCGPCRAQHPLYDEVKRKFKNRPDVVFLSVSTDEERSAVGPFLKKWNWQQKVYFEDGLSRTLEISSIPTTIIVDRNGEVFSRMNGYQPERFVDMLTERIRQALAN